MLKETFEMVVERMKKYRSLYEQNETAMRSQIIEPILIGWDVENPEEQMFLLRKAFQIILF